MRIIDSERGVPTARMKHCVKFYIDGLLFTKVSESADRCTVAFGSDQVVFRKAHKDEVRALHDAGFSLCFRGDGIHGYYERVRATGRVKFEQELELMQPGVWQFSLIDPNGYPVVFAMP
jgi:hypothetical protein